MDTQNAWKRTEPIEAPKNRSQLRGRDRFPRDGTRNSVAVVPTNRINNRRPRSRSPPISAEQEGINGTAEVAVVIVPSRLPLESRIKIINLLRGA